MTIPEAQQKLEGKYILLSIRPVDESDGQFAAYCDELGLATCGANREDAVERLENTITRVLDLATERGEIIGFLAGRGVHLHPLDAPKPAAVIALAEPRPATKAPTWMQLAGQMCFGTVRHSGFMAAPASRA